MRRKSLYFVATVCCVIALVASITGAATSTPASTSAQLTATANDLRAQAATLDQLAVDATSTSVGTTTTPPTTQPATTQPATTIPPTTTTQPAAGAFLSYPHQASASTFSGNNLTIANKSWVGFGSVCLTVSNAVNVTITNVDFDGCVGDIFLVNVTGNIRIDHVRAHNTGNGTIGSGHSNVIQFNNVWQSAPDNGVYGISNVSALGGHTEDMISIFKSGGVDSAHRLTIDNIHLESPLPPDPQAWTSGSGTCVNLADAGGHDIILRNSTFLNCGAVGVQMNQPTRVVVDHNVAYGAARATSNVGLSQWASSSCTTCTGNAYTNDRVWWVKPNGGASSIWLSGTYPVATSGNTTQDTTINPANLKVVL